MKTYGGVVIQLQSFLTSALGGAECLGSRPDRSTPIHIEQGVGRTSVPVYTFRYCWQWNYDSSVIQPVASSLRHLSYPDSPHKMYPVDKMHECHCVLAAVETNWEIRIGPWYFIIVLRRLWNVRCQFEPNHSLLDARPRTTQIGTSVPTNT